MSEHGSIPHTTVTVAGLRASLWQQRIRSHFYTNDTDTTPVTTSSFALAEDWTSGGAHYFKGTDAAGPGSRFILMRVSGNNNTLEANTSGKAYPASIDPSIGGYGIFTRQ
jgi:hypothetical protein